MSFPKSLLVPLALLACVGIACLGGCNTVEGVGEDIQRAGEHLEDAAD